MTFISKLLVFYTYAANYFFKRKVKTMGKHTLNKTVLLETIQQNKP